MAIHKGGCHCGRVQFEVDAPEDIEATVCNCSICTMSGFIHLFVAKKNFKLICGGDALQTYTFGTGLAQHMFCRGCGIKSYYVPRSHPDGYSVNVNCLDPATLASVTKTDFDGRNWENNVSKLSLLSD